MAESIVTAGAQLHPVCFVMTDFLKSRKCLFLFNGGRREWRLSRAVARKGPLKLLMADLSLQTRNHNTD